MQPAQFLESAIAELKSLKKVAERAMAQVSEKDFFSSPDTESNSIAVLVKHLAGNMRSRWTDFLTSDGEKPDRHRDSEFITKGDSRESLLQRWEESWNLLFSVVEALEPEDLSRTVLIRGKGQPAYQAIIRQLSHYSLHVGQILYLAKHFAGSSWQTLSVPKGQSEEYNKRMWGK